MAPLLPLPLHAARGSPVCHFLHRQHTYIFNAIRPNGDIVLAARRVTYPVPEFYECPHALKRKRRKKSFLFFYFSSDKSETQGKEREFEMVAQNY